MFLPGVGGGVSAPSRVSSRGSGGRPAMGEGGVMVKVTELVEPVLVL